MHRRASSSQREIERRFIVKEIPGSMAIPQISSRDAAQTYLMLTRDGERVEIKRKGTSFFLVSERNRSEAPLTSEQFDAIWDSQGQDRISSIRYPVSVGKRAAELNVYKGKLEGLVTLTASFGSRKDASRFHPEYWFGSEVTHDSEYRNGALAKMQGPPEHRVSVQSELDRGLKRLYDASLSLLEKKGPILVLIETPPASSAQPYRRRDIAAELHERLKDVSVLISTEDYRRDGAAYPGRLAEYLNVLLAEAGDKKVIIVAGPDALHKSLVGMGDLTAFVEAGVRERVATEVITDSGRIDWSPFNTLRRVAGEMEYASKDNATAKESTHVVIRSGFDPREESAGVVTEEFRVKYKAEGITHDLLRKLGASRIASLKQENSYFVPSEVALAERGEMIGVRRHGERTVFTHNGPRSEGRGATRRYVLRFEVDNATEPLLLATYRTLQPINEIMDTAMYHCNGVVFALNTAIGIGGGQPGVRHLGNFVEFTVPLQHETGLWERVNRLVREMGLAQSKVYTEAYRDM